MLSGLGGRALSLTLSLLTVPLTLGYLGPERYGMWLTISSVIALLSFTDLGIGLGLLNAVTRTIATGRVTQARVQISSALALITCLAIVLAAVFLVTYPFIPWAQVLAVTSPQAKAEAAPAVAALLAVFLIGMPVSVGTQVRIARQETYLVHLAAAVGNLSSLAALLLVIVTEQGVPALVVAMAAPPVIAAAVNAVVLFRRNAPELRPSLAIVDLRTGASLVRSGFLFFVLQIAMTVAFTTDTLVVAQIVGPEAVAEYGVAARLFLIPLALVTIGLSPLWPAYGEAIAHGDVAWARATLDRSIKGGLLIAIPTAGILVIFGQWIISVWANGAVTPPFGLLLALGIWTLQSTVGNAVAMLLNGAHELRFQAAAAVVMAIANLALSIWLTSRIGVAGVVWGTVISYGAFVLVPMALYVPGVLRRLANARTSLGPPGNVIQG